MAKEERLVQWAKQPKSEASWESIDIMKQEFLTFHLEDKECFATKGIVRPLIIHTYGRRGERGKLHGTDSQWNNKCSYAFKWGPAEGFWRIVGGKDILEKVEV